MLMKLQLQVASGRLLQPIKSTNANSHVLFHIIICHCTEFIWQYYSYSLLFLIISVSHLALDQREREGERDPKFKSQM